MKKLIVRFLKWLLSLLEEPAPAVQATVLVDNKHEVPKPVDKIPAKTQPLPEAIDRLLPSAREFAAQYADRAMSGEAKRHQVYALMIKKHPEASKRDIGVAIEWVVRFG